MSPKSLVKSLLGVALALGASNALAQMPNSYGTSINLETAKKADCPS